MAYTTKLFILFLIFVATLLGYNYIIRPFSQLKEIEVAQQPLATPITQTKTVEEKLFDTLNTEQKILQVLTIPITITNTNTASESAILTWTKQKKPGFVIVFGSEIATGSAKNLYKELQTATSSEPLDIAISIDHEGGTVQRYNGIGFTKLPSWQDFCAIENRAERIALLEKSASELQEVGVRIVLAPVFDTKVVGSPLRTRTCSADQAVISERSKEYIQAMTKYNVLPVLKHFPNIGFAKKDLHTNFDTVSIKPDDLLAFKSILDAFPKIGVMTTHVGITNQDPELPCSLSANCVNELRTTYNQSLIISDALDMRSTQGNISTESASLTTVPQLSIQALQAGNDSIILGEQVTTQQLDEVLNLIIKEYNTNELFKERIDESVKKIIRYKLEMRE